MDSHAFIQAGDAGGLGIATPALPELTVRPATAGMPTKKQNLEKVWGVMEAWAPRTHQVARESY